MTEYLRLKKSNCKNCYKCIRHCPVKSIRFSGNQAHIVGDECILCGHCFVVCPQNAKEIRCDTDKVKTYIKGRETVIATLAPSFVASYGCSFASAKKALMQLGFADVRETAEGAAQVKQEYDRLVDENKYDMLISSCCHTVNLLISKYYPEALKYLAPVATPMFASCEIIKQENPSAKTVFIGPCISKKAEAESYDETVDSVLTFEELSDWLEEEKISFENIPENSQQTRTRIFPTSGGILNSMNKNNAEWSYLVVDGIENCIEALKDICEHKISKCFIEMSACAGSCINGPVTEKHRSSLISGYSAVSRSAGSEDYPLPVRAKNIKREHKYLGTNKAMPGERQIEEILRSMGKTKPEDELNCGSCGYNTCREKAVAVFQGKAEISMCLPFLKEKAESFSDNIINNTPNGIFVLNENLEVQQINKAAREIMNIRSTGDVLGEQVIRILDPKDFIDVLNTGIGVRHKRTYLAEYQKYVEESIVYDKSYNIIICIMRDITAEETEKIQKDKICETTINITDKVIEKQMRVAQEIASLLGETTAETKIALTNLKESLKPEK